MICNRKAFVRATGCPQISVDISFPNLSYCDDPEYVSPKLCDACDPRMLPQPDINFPGAQKCFSIYITLDENITYARDFSIGTVRLSSAEDCLFNNYTLYVGLRAPCILGNITAGPLIQHGGRYSNNVIGDIKIKKTICMASLVVNITGISKIALDAAPPRVNLSPDVVVTLNIGISAPNIKFSLRAPNLPDMSKGTNIEDVCKLTVLFNFKAHRPKPKIVEIQYVPEVAIGVHTCSVFTLFYQSGAKAVAWKRDVIHIPDPVTLYLTKGPGPFFVDGRPGGALWNIGYIRPEEELIGPTGHAGDMGPTGTQGARGADLDPLRVCTYLTGVGKDYPCGPRCILVLDGDCDGCEAPCGAELFDIAMGSVTLELDPANGIGEYDDRQMMMIACYFDAVQPHVDRDRYGLYYPNPGYDIIDVAAFLENIFPSITSIFDT